MALDDYPEALRAALESSNWDFLLPVQMSYVRKLIEAKRSSEALRESKRLLGITPLHPHPLVESLSATAVAIKADALVKDKSLPDAIGEANAYLEAINKGNVKEQPLSALAYPATTEALAAFTTDARPGVAIAALLYAGRYDEAKAKAETLLAMAGATQACCLP